ncbi:hypothetical protein [Sphingomonas citri]
MPDDTAPPRHSPRRWSEEDDAELRRRLATREPIGVVARAMGRTIDGVRGRAQQIGASPAQRLRPWREDPRRKI